MPISNRSYLYGITLYIRKCHDKHVSKQTQIPKFLLPTQVMVHPYIHTRTYLYVYRYVCTYANARYSPYEAGAGSQLSKFLDSLLVLFHFFVALSFLYICMTMYVWMSICI